MPIQEKTVKILTQPGLNILAPTACKGCSHLTARRTCTIWAFPETKWRGRECLEYSEITGSGKLQ